MREVGGSPLGSGGAPVGSASALRLSVCPLAPLSATAAPPPPALLLPPAAAPAWSGVGTGPGTGPSRRSLPSCRSRVPAVRRRRLGGQQSPGQMVYVSPAATPGPYRQVNTALSKHGKFSGPGRAPVPL